MPEPMEDQEAVAFEAVAFAEFRSTIRNTASFWGQGVYVERLALVGWPPRTEFAVTFEIDSRSVEKRYPVWIDIQGEWMNPDEVAVSNYVTIEESIRKHLI